MSLSARKARRSFALTSSLTRFRVWGLGFGVWGLGFRFAEEFCPDLKPHQV